MGITRVKEIAFVRHGSRAEKDVCNVESWY